MGKSGSPAPNPMTGRPAAFSALALASTASVADSEIAAMRLEMRGRSMLMSPSLQIGPRDPSHISGPVGRVAAAAFPPISGYRFDAGPSGT